jgi:hypothetical protein
MFPFDTVGMELQPLAADECSSLPGHVANGHRQPLQLSALHNTGGSKFFTLHFSLFTLHSPL